MSRLVQAPQNLLRWSFSKPTMIQHPRAVHHKPTAVLNPICQKTRVRPTHHLDQISDFQQYHAPPLSTWCRRAPIQREALILAASLENRPSDGITLHYQNFRSTSRKLTRNPSRTKARTLPCECGRAGKLYYSALVRSRLPVPFICVVYGIFFSVGTGLNILLLLIPVSVSQSADNERAELIEHSGFSVLLWENITSWCSPVSDILQHENANHLRATVSILSMIPLVKVFF